MNTTLNTFYKKNYNFIKFKFNSQNALSIFEFLLILIYFFLSFYEGYINQLVGPLNRYVIFVLSFLLIFKTKRIKFDVISLMFLFFFLFNLLSLLWSDLSSSIFSSHVNSQVGFSLLIFSISNTKFDSKKTTFLLNYVLFLSFSMAFLALFFSQPYKFSIESRQVLTLFDKQIDPNNLSIFYLTGLSILLAFSKQFFENIFKSLIYFSVLSIFFYAVFLTGSRGSFVSLLFTIFIFFLILFLKSNILLKILFVFGFFILLFIIIEFEIINYFIDDFGRIFDFDAYGDGSDRLPRWILGFQMFLERPLFGLGWSGYNILFHNTFLTILIDVGLFGFILFFLPIALIIFKFIKMKFYLPLLLFSAAFFPSLFIEAINKRFLWNSVLLSIILYNSHQNEE